MSFENQEYITGMKGSTVDKLYQMFLKKFDEVRKKIKEI